MAGYQDFVNSPSRLCARPLPRLRSCACDLMFHSTRFKGSARSSCVASFLLAQCSLFFNTSFATSTHAPCFVIPFSLLIHHLSHHATYPIDLSSFSFPLLFLPLFHKRSVHHRRCFALGTRQACSRPQSEPAPLPSPIPFFYRRPSPILLSPRLLDQC